MILFISILVFLTATSKKLVPQHLYPLAIISITIALLFQTSLITSYIVGWDEHNEYYVYRLVETSSRWESGKFIGGATADYYSMLSVTILPTMYSKMLDIEGTWIFKVIYPLLLSFVPLALYQFYKAKVDNQTAFFSIFFFVSNFVFFRLFPARQIVAELFFVLSFCSLILYKNDSNKKRICFLVFSMALIVSHYSLSYLFLFFIFSIWLYAQIFKKGERMVATSNLLLFATIAFAWYMYTSASAPFHALLNVFDRTFRNFFEDFLNPQTRGSTVLRGVGLSEVVSITRQIGRGFHYITELLILVGFISLLRKREKDGFDGDYILLSFMNLTILAMCVLLPFFASSFRMERFYQLSLLILSPLCIYGWKTLISFIKNIGPMLYIHVQKIESVLLVVLILIPFFLFQTEFVYEFTGDLSWSYSLRNQRMEPTKFYNPLLAKQDVFGSVWLSQVVDIDNIWVYTDIPLALTSYGMIYGRFQRLMNTTQTFESPAYIYMRYLNVKYEIVMGGSPYWNITEFSILNEQNKIYSNGYCDIYKS
jgi:uncharacterized membrane protein